MSWSYGKDPSSSQLMDGTKPFWDIFVVGHQRRTGTGDWGITFLVRVLGLFINHVCKAFFKWMMTMRAMRCVSRHVRVLGLVINHVCNAFFFKWMMAMRAMRCVSRHVRVLGLVINHVCKAFFKWMRTMRATRCVSRHRHRALAA